MAVNKLRHSLTYSQEYEKPSKVSDNLKLSTFKLEPTFNKYDDSCFLRFLSQFSVLDPYIVACQTSAKPGNSAGTPVGSSPTNRCKNVYFSLHAGTPNKKIGTLLQEMKIQLMHVKNDVSIIKARNNTSCKESTETLLREIKETLLEMQNDIASIKENKMLSESRHTCTEVKKNCAELYKSGKTSSGVYTIDLDGHGAFSVFCDQTAAGGGWTVFQKRLDGSVDFYRGWTDYKNGFGNLHGEFWLGLDKIHRLTTTIKNKLRVHLMDTKSKTAYAEYNMLAVASENKYKLSLGTYSGNAGDSLSRHRGQPFATKDKDRYRCAVTYKGAWW
nr:ficolin-2-like [Pocillopora verrucosa]